MHGIKFQQHSMKFKCQILQQNSMNEGLYQGTQLNGLMSYFSDENIYLKILMNLKIDRNEKLEFLVQRCEALKFRAVNFNKFKAILVKLPLLNHTGHLLTESTSPKNTKTFVSQISNLGH